mgnify:CR=1 FL=1
MSASLHQMMRELLDRSVRIETRLVRLMQHSGLDPEGYPTKAPTNSTPPENKHDTHDHNH